MSMSRIQQDYQYELNERRETERERWAWEHAKTPEQRKAMKEQGYVPQTKCENFPNLNARINFSDACRELRHEQ